MTVRVNKQPFNLREKLSELERPIGLKGSELMKSETAQEAGSLLGVGRRNFVINPKFDINQKGISALNHTTSSVRLMDGWSVYTNLSNHSANYDIVNDGPVEAGIYRSVRISSAATSTYAANNEYQFRQKFEGYDVKRLGWGTSGAKHSTVSFWVKSSIVGKYGVTAFFFGASSADRRFVAEYNIDSANTWEYKTVSIPPLIESINQVNYEADASGMLMWGLGAQANYQATPGSWYSTYKIVPTGSVPFFATNGATFYLTGVQWEIGKNATEFEHRSYGEELALCQRYYWEIGSYQSGNWAPLSLFIAGNGTRAFGSIRTPVTMRSHPAITFSNVNLHSTYTENVTSLFRYSQTGRNLEYDGLAFEANTASGLVSGQVYRLHIKNVSGTSGYIRFNAEL